MNTVCNSGCHEANNINSFDPARNVNQVVAMEEESSSSSTAFQTRQQPDRAENAEREAGASMMKSLLQIISRPLPVRQVMRTNRARYQHTTGCDHPALSFQQANNELQQMGK